MANQKVSINVNLNSVEEVKDDNLECKYTEENINKSSTGIGINYRK